MKNGIEWYQYLSDAEKIKFKSNCVSNFNSLMNQQKFLSFESFIGAGFGWMNSPEGWEYWDGISKRKL